MQTTMTVVERMAPSRDVRLFGLKLSIAARGCIAVKMLRILWRWIEDKLLWQTRLRCLIYVCIHEASTMRCFKTAPRGQQMLVMIPSGGAEEFTWD